LITQRPVNQTDVHKPLRQLCVEPAKERKETKTTDKEADKYLWGNSPKVGRGGIRSKMIARNVEEPHMLHLTGGFLRCPIGQAPLQKMLR